MVVLLWFFFPEAKTMSLKSSRDGIAEPITAVHLVFQQMLFFTFWMARVISFTETLLLVFAVRAGRLQEC